MKYTIDLQSYTEEELNDLPLGVIHLDENGRILDYNAYEAGISKLERDSVVGKNFFAQIAPCTSVPEFLGKFFDGMKSGKLNESFTFEFPFLHGARNVAIQMIGDPASKTAWIFVADASQILKLKLDENRTITLWQIAGPPLPNFET